VDLKIRLFIMRFLPNYIKALDRDRTGDLILTKDVLCQLSYKGKPLERETGFEPATSSLEGWRSTN
jgi:hypothetical protein